jgi:hypothetical protein
MKRYIIAAFTLLAFGFLPAKADTDKLPAADGWTKITTVPTASEIANNYYVFVDATNDLMLGTAKGNHQATKWYSLGLYYQTSVDPTSANINGKTWILETQGNGFALRNLEYSALCFQTESAGPWMYDTNDVPSTNQWTQINLIYADGSWTLQNGKHGGNNYIGPWDGGNFTNGAECAANKSTSGEIGHFQIYTISRAQFKQNLLDNASSSNPVDLTPWYVTNGTFDLGNRNGWTQEGSGGNNNTSYGGGCEIWHRSSFNIHQDLTVPNGKYKVSLQMAGTTGAGKVYATSGGTSKEKASSAAAGSNFQNTILSMIQDRTFGQTITDEISVSNGLLTIGMKCETTDQWLNFDNFKLYCTGLDLSAYQEQLADLVEECNDFITSSVVPDACETIISNAITQYNKEYATVKEYSTAIVALTTVLDTYRNDAELQSAYADYKALRTEVLKLEDTDLYKYTDGGTAKSTFDSALSSANSAVEESTTATAINTQTDAIRAAALVFIGNVTAEDGNPFNITFLASTAAADWQTADGLNAAATAPAWSVPKPDASMADFVESYTEAEGGESITGNILYQTLSGMPAGYYTVALYAAASYTPNRGKLVAKCTDGQPNITFGFAGESTLSLPVKHRTTLTAEDQVPVNLSVQLASSGDLTFGIKKTAAGSNWHVAQIYTITYSKDPDLTVLKADRDALVAEAEGILASADAQLLTTAQRAALQGAIDEANAANTYDGLNTATLTTLPNAIQTALQQIATVKENRVNMIAALELFENDYNLADGTDYRRLTMSAAAWTSLLGKVNAVSNALDDVSQAANYGTLVNDLIAQMEATDASLVLFKGYKSMVDGTTDLGIVGEYGEDSHMDDDDAEEAAIAALNTAFVGYAASQADDFNVSAFLGENLDFNAAEGTIINNDNSNSIYNITGWEVEYADADTWAVLQNQHSEHLGQLFMRKNWGSSPTSLLVGKQKMLPEGRYRLSLSWNSTMANIINQSQFFVGQEATAIGEATEKATTLTYDFEVTGAAQPFSLFLGFKKTGIENTPAQLIVDDVTLTALGANSRLMADYNPAALWFDATESPYAAARGVSVTPTAPNQIIKAVAGQFTAPTSNVVVEGLCSQLAITDGSPLDIQEPFKATQITNSRSLAKDKDAYTVCLPYSLSSNSSVSFYQLTAINEGRLHFDEVEETEPMKPYLAVAKATASLNASDTTVAVTTEEAIEVGDYIMKGTVTGISRTEAENLGAYILQTGNQWRLVDANSGEEVHIPAFRAYVVGKDASAHVLIDTEFYDVVTGADGLKLVEVSEAEFYDLQGRKVGTRPVCKGLYVVSGKKIIRK